MNIRKLLVLCLAVALAGCSPLRRLPASDAGTASPQPDSGAAATKSPAQSQDDFVLSPDIPSGQYSAITWLGGNQYAVVHDKLNGGGILFFSFDIDPVTGAIGRKVQVETPDATRLSGITGLDNEGIAYADGKLYVSAESDQSVREYALDATPTGRSLAVPETFLWEQIEVNAGFEALTYSPVTRLFWTTTEKPLRADGAASRLHRLQSFGPDLQPARQYLYQMDAPLRSAEDTRAYVHGIAAMTALDDGRLVVLEREVYVPASIFRALGETFSLFKLYVVDPVHDKGRILSKELLSEFSTTASNLANYEGMCLGPTLVDGRRTLVLISDSQGGMGGLTREYLKVLAVPL